jgi:hypothetical protein
MAARLNKKLGLYLNLVPGQGDPVQKGLSTDVAAGARAGAHA